jgi:hypothetical protein
MLRHYLLAMCVNLTLCRIPLWLLWRFKLNRTRLSYNFFLRVLTLPGTASVTLRNAWVMGVLASCWLPRGAKSCVQKLRWLLWRYACLLLLLKYLSRRTIVLLLRMSLLIASVNKCALGFDCCKLGFARDLGKRLAHF